MAALANGLANGVNGTKAPPRNRPGRPRFDDIPDAIDIIVSEDGEEEAVEVNLKDLPEDPTELCTLLENENVDKHYWQTTALAYAKQGNVDHAIEMVSKGMGSLRRDRPEDRLTMLTMLCWMWLWKCRRAPRVKPDGQLASEARVKDYYIHQATQVLNEASRISPSYSPLFLARGVLSLLRASLQPPSKAAPGTQDNSERVETLRQALKCFDDALRASAGKNLMAVMGRARVQFALGKYGDALRGYQEALERAPELVEPDPRIGIGCCLWQLGHREEARQAWDRSLELSPGSKVANILLGIYHLYYSSQFPTADPNFAAIYKQAMTVYTQRAFKLDDRDPLTCSTFGGYFLMRKAMQQVERLARRSIELTDVNAIASDGWYLLARKEHYDNDTAKASEYYYKADQARGGEDRGYLPAKFGAAQVRVLHQDLDGAKFRLEKIVQQSKSIEPMILLGTLYAEDVFSAQIAGLKEDKSTEAKKAIALLEAVRMNWKDPKKKIPPDSAVLLNLARLYEADAPEKSLACLQQVEQMEFDEIPAADRPDDIDDPMELKAALREQLPPQLLNNMACFHFLTEQFGQARELFQTALNACVQIGDKDQSLDTDALVTTISFNLARTYEAEGMLEEAQQVYVGLVARHENYTDANTRLSYIALRQAPTEEGPKAVQDLFGASSNNLEVRALYGWYLSKSKRRTGNIAEDTEQKHYKDSLRHFDKHDRYSLTGMGNIYLAVAREMRRESDEDRRKRSKMYERAVEFFDKALQLDPRNAYAAHGIGIAMVEDKKDFAGAVQVFQKVKESLGGTRGDASVLTNLGHVFCELKQYSRAIENYEAALGRDRQSDPQLLACLGRVWFMRGKLERSLSPLRQSLEFSLQALQVAPEQIHFQFNVAFVQFQIAQTILAIAESQRTSEDLQEALEGLNHSIESLATIAKSPNPPFPRSDIEQRASMGKNTIRRQLEKAVQSQKEFESKNASRLEAARQARDAEVQRREEDRRKAQEAAEEARMKIQEERQRMQEHDRELADLRAEEEKRLEALDMTTDSETGERRKRVKKKATKRKKKGDDDIIDDLEEDADDDGMRSPRPDGGDEKRKSKKRRLERKSNAKQSKYKSAETIEDSDEDDPALEEMANNEGLAAKMNANNDEEENEDENGDVPMASAGEEDEPVNTAAKSRRGRAVLDDSDGDEDAEERQIALANLENGLGEGDTEMFGEDTTAEGLEDDY